MRCCCSVPAPFNVCCDRAQCAARGQRCWQEKIFPCCPSGCSGGHSYFFLAFPLLPSDRVAWILSGIRGAPYLRACRFCSSCLFCPQPAGRIECGWASLACGELNRRADHLLAGDAVQQAVNSGAGELSRCSNFT